MTRTRRFACFLNNHLEHVMIGSLTSTLVVCLSYSTFVRYFVTAPFFTSLTHKAEELALFAFAWLVYWGACLATKEKAHFRIEAHMSFLPVRWQRWKNLPGDILWVAFNLFIVWQGWLLTRSAIDNPEFSLSLNIHMAVIYSVIPVTFLATTFRLVQHYLPDAHEPNVQ